MKWLLWREYRLNRLILITGAVILLLPYIITLIVLCWPRTTETRVSYIAGAIAFAAAALYSLGLSQLTLALLGGNAIAGERADRSAEFIGYLPLPRTRLLRSKLSLAFSATALIWGPNLLVLWILVSLFPELLLGSHFSDTIPYTLSYIAITGLVFFGVSWLISSFQSSPTFAVAGGLITPVIVAMGLWIAVWTFDETDTSAEEVSNLYMLICVFLAVMSFSAGTLFYLNRVEP